ncbi:MAG: hypothetical protein BWX71_00958 [Deltaproteobacteria bacterium ADurb.Bin072]|nr:MAG: hypothetical protein BWX71_00958 [Deltaproteobacteria bacterium ADurb.Bin072]
MRSIAEDLEDYLGNSLGITASIDEWVGSGSLPQILTGNYTILHSKISGIDCLFLVPRDDFDPTPGALEKHIDLLRRSWKGQVVFAPPSISSYKRKRLIQQGISFIVTSKQMYLPALGLALHELFPAKIRCTEVLSPSAQLLVIASVLGLKVNDSPLSDLARKLGYQAMTMTRVSRELDYAGLARLETRGRDRRMTWVTSDAKDLWESALNRLSSPVSRRMWVSEAGNIGKPLLSGLSALSAYSMLASPGNTVIAVQRTELSSFLQEHSLQVIDQSETDSDSVEIEVWKYSPALLATDGKVDRLSLFLSLRESADERVQGALSEMMRDLKW